MIQRYGLKCECGWETDIDLSLYQAKVSGDKHITENPEGTHYVWLSAPSICKIISFVERNADATKSKENKESAIREHLKTDA